VLMCDRHDIGLAIHGEEAGSQDQPTVFIYDNYPGGIGFSEPLFTLHGPLLAQTRALIERCPCDVGCPACVGPIGQTGPLAKTVALSLFRALGVESEAVVPGSRWTSPSALGEEAATAEIDPPGGPGLGV